MVWITLVLVLLASCWADQRLTHGKYPEKTSERSRLLLKDPSLPVNELLEKTSGTGSESLPWPKLLFPAPRLHNKSHKSDPPGADKTRAEVAGLFPKTPLTAANRTVQRTHPDPPLSPAPPEGPSRPDDPPPPPAHRYLDPEENRPGRSGQYQPSGDNRNSSRSLAAANRRRLSAPLFRSDVLTRELDQDCLSECRSEKDEQESFCLSEFAVNGIVHDIEAPRRGVRVVTMMVGGDGFYRMSRLFVAPDSFSFKVRLLVVDTCKCSRPCPDIMLGTRYIVMGHVYHRRRHLPGDLLSGVKLRSGDGLLRSSSYVRRFNKRRHQRVLEASRRCR